MGFNFKDEKCTQTLHLCPDMAELMRLFAVLLSDPISCGSTGIQRVLHPPSLTFQHLLPNSARIYYTTEGALFISMHLSTETASTL